MLFFSLLAGALTLSYVFIQGRFYLQWSAFLNEEILQDNAIDPIKWTVIVPARNEAAHVLATLKSLSGQAAEIIVVNDHSTDKTEELVSSQDGIVLLNLPVGLSGKKAAITHALAVAKGDWIATIDADVQAKPGWLAALDSARLQHSVAVAGPVMLAPAETWFERWQALDFCGMMAITAASLRIGDFAMGNGANLAFSKAAFEAVGGYESELGKESVSGDDMVLLGKLLKQYPGQIAFAKTPEAVVATPPQKDIASFVQQRWRWSAKTGLNQQPSLTMTLGLVWAFHLGLILGIPLVLFGAMNSAALFVAWACKFILDYFLLNSASTHFDRKNLLDWTYPWQSFAHASYVAGVGTLSLLPFEFEWKGRKARR